MTANDLSDPQPLDDLLATKLETPLIGHSIVPRRRLTDRLITGMERRLTLLTAPTGYGKTTLLAEWLSGILMPDWRIVWVTVDALDNEPLRLWSYIAAAFHKVYPRLRYAPQRGAQDTFGGSRFAALTRFINEITQIPYQLVLVLDDYQWITADAVHEEIRYLLDHQPKNLHLLISSRATPPFPLSRLRAQRQLVEVTAKDLSFTLQEANHYFSSVMKIDIEQDQATALHSATEGWIAGLQLATLSLQGRSDRQAFIANLPGGNRQIFEYLTEEVLDQQTLAVRDFMLKTSILSEFSAPLCDAVLERSDSREMLSRIQQANLFIVSLDEYQHWYSYHRLFADTLQLILRDTDAEIIPELHRKACVWLQEHGHPDKAVSHALATGDLEQAARIIDACALQAVIGFDLVQLAQWIGRFSDDLISKRPQLAIYYALANYLLERFDKVEPMLQALEHMLGKARENSTPVEDEGFFRWEIAAIRACLDSYRGNYDQSIPTITALLQNPPPKDVYFSGFMTHGLAEGYAIRGDLDAAIEAYNKGCQYAIDHGLVLEYCYSMTELAYVRKMQGRLRDAGRDYQDLLDYAHRLALPSNIVAFGKTGLAEIALEQNQMAQASEQVNWVIDHLDRIETSPLSWIRQEWLFVRLVKYFLARQDVRTALAFYEKAMNGFRANRHVVYYLAAQLIDMQVNVWLVTGELSAKDLNFEEQIAFLNPLGKPNPAIPVAMARCYLVQGQAEKALAILSGSIPSLRAAGMHERLLKALALQALAWEAAGNLQQAMQSLHQALQIAAPEGYRRVFMDEGIPMKALLSQYGQQAVGEDKEILMARSLISEMDQQVTHPSIPSRDSQPAANLVYPLLEPLSHRELEILKLMIEGKSTKEISVALMVSINTTKVHIKNIYRKIGAHTRSALRQRAKDLGIFDNAQFPSR